MYIYEISSKNELKEIQIKNSTSYHFDDIINITDLDLDKVLFNEENRKYLICNDSYKTPYGTKVLHIIFDKVDGYVRKHYSTKYLGF